MAGVDRGQRHAAPLAELDRPLSGSHRGRLVAAPRVHRGQHAERDDERGVLAGLLGERDGLLGVGARPAEATEREVALRAGGERVGEGADRDRGAPGRHQPVEQLDAVLVLLDPQPAVGG